MSSSNCIAIAMNINNLERNIKMLNLTLEQAHLIDIMSDDIMDLWIQFGDVDTLDFYHQAGQHWQENFTPIETEMIVENVVMNTFG